MKERTAIFQDLFFWLSMLLGGFFLSLTLWFGFGMDQSIYAYSAWVWKEYKLLPYIGAWDGNFPGIFIIHRLALEIFGGSILGFRIFDCLIQLSGLGMVYYLARELSGSKLAGLFSGVVYSLYYFGLGNVGVGQREGSILFLLLLAIILSLKLAEQRYLRAILVGLLAGFIFLIKPHYGLYGAIFGLFFLIEGKEKKPVKVLLELFIFSFFLLVPALVIVFIYLRADYLQELYYATIWFNFEIYNKSVNYPFGLSWFLFRIPSGTFLDHPLIFVSGLFALLVMSGKSKGFEKGKWQWLVIVLLLMSFISYQLQAKYFPYHLIPFWGLMILISSAGWAWIGKRLKEDSDFKRGNLLIGIFYFLLMILVLMEQNLDVIRFCSRYCFRSLDEAYSAKVGNYDPHLANEQYQAVRYLESMIIDEDQLEFFGAYPLVPYLLKKKLPSRFVCVQHLLLMPGDGKPRPLQEKWIEEYSQAVITAKPKFFLISDYIPGFRTFNLSSPYLSQALAKSFPELSNFLNENYRLINIIGGIQIYELIDENSDKK